MSLHKHKRVILDGYVKKFEKAFEVYKERRSRASVKNRYSTQHKHYSELPLKGGG